MQNKFRISQYFIPFVNVVACLILACAAVAVKLIATATADNLTVRAMRKSIDLLGSADQPKVNKRQECVMTPVEY